jgi:integrase
MLYPKVQEVFILARFGVLQDHQVIDRLNAVLKRINKPTETKQQQPAPYTLKNCIASYCKDKSSSWSQKTRLEYDSYFKLILDVLGDVAVCEITRDTIRQLREILSKLPANLYKKYPNMSIQQVLRLNDVAPMSITTANKLLILTGSLLRHSIAEGLITTNPATGLKIQKRKVSSDTERKAYSTEDIKKIIKHLPSPSKQPERYWIPLIAMYSGLRQGEISGLHTADIVQLDDIWCFDVNDEDDKRLKTVSSKRIVPVHPELSRLGFLSFVEQQSTKRLWPELLRRESDGYCHAIGKWFQRFNRQYITDDPLKCFHSLRHSFADSLKQAGTQETIIGELLGHANSSISTGRYGKKYKPEILYKAVSLVVYGKA